MSKKTTKTIIVALSVLLAAMLIAILMMFLNASRSSDDHSDFVVEETPEPTPEIIEVERIIIELDSDEVLRGSSVIPKVIIQPENATDKTFEIRSDNERILRPQGNYWVAVAIGEANLIATAPNGIVGFLTVSVEAPHVESITFEENEITMLPGEMLFLSPIIEPEDAMLRESIAYTSSDEDVVTVSNDGRLTAVEAGLAIITGTADGISVEIRVNVVIPVRNINIIMPRRVYSVGDEAEFEIRVEPENATNASVSVSFSGAAVTSTGDNSFRCDEAGEVKITFTARGGTNIEVVVTVHDLQALANEVHRLTIIERERANLPTLERDQTLTQIALIRAREIITLFSHTRPDGRGSVTVFAENGIVVFDGEGRPIRSTGENLAIGQRTPAEVMQDWMESRGHREAIQNSNFGIMGVGVVMDDNGRLYWTQIFMD